MWPNSIPLTPQPQFNQQYFNKLTLQYCVGQPLYKQPLYFQQPSHYLQALHILQPLHYQQSLQYHQPSHYQLPLYYQRPLYYQPLQCQQPLQYQNPLSLYQPPPPQDQQPMNPKPKYQIPKHHKPQPKNQQWPRTPSNRVFRGHCNGCGKYGHSMKYCRFVRNQHQRQEVKDQKNKKIDIVMW